MTTVVAMDVAEAGLTANAICPGYVSTPFEEKQILDSAKASGLTEDEFNRDVLLAAPWTKSFVTVERIAGMTLLLRSDLAETITGVAPPVDGGWTAA